MHYSVTIEFEKPSSMDKWTAQTMADLDSKLKDIRKSHGLLECRTTVETINIKDDFWKIHLFIFDVTASQVLDALEELKLRIPFKLFSRVEQYQVVKTINQLRLKQLTYLLSAPIPELIQYIDCYMLKETGAWIKDMPVVDRSLIEDSENYWKASLLYGDKVVGEAALNLLAYSRKAELYSYLNSGGSNLGEVPFSFVAKILGFKSPIREVDFDFDGIMETDLRKANNISVIFQHSNIGF